MTEELHRQRVLNFLEVYYSGDIEAALARCTDDVEFIANAAETLVFERVPQQLLDQLGDVLREPRRGRAHLDFDGPHYGAPELRDHVLNVMFLMDASGRDSWARFQIMLNRAAPRVARGAGEWPPFSGAARPRTGPGG